MELHFVVDMLVTRFLFKTIRNILHIYSIFNKTHNDTNFNMEHDFKGKFHFLNNGIKRTSGDKRRRKIFRKNTWSGVYQDYNNFCTTSYK